MYQQIRRDNAALKTNCPDLLYQDGQGDKLVKQHITNYFVLINNVNSSAFRSGLLYHLLTSIDFYLKKISHIIRQYLFSNRSKKPQGLPQ